MSQPKLDEEMPLEFPPLYILPSKKITENPKELRKMHSLERALGKAHHTDVREVRLIITNYWPIEKPRIRMELMQRRLFTEDITGVEVAAKDGGGQEQNAAPVEAPKKKRKSSDGDGLGENWTKINKTNKGNEVIMFASSEESEEERPPRAKRTKTDNSKMHTAREIITIDSSTESEAEPTQLSLRTRQRSRSGKSPIASSPVAPENFSPATSIISKEITPPVDTIKALKLEWYYDSVEAGHLLPIEKYLVYVGRIVETPQEIALRKPTKLPSSEIYARAKADTPPRQTWQGHRSRGSGGSSSQHTQKAKLIQEETDDYEDDAVIPVMPDYCQDRYSCRRRTPLTGPNDPFIALLKTIREQRLLLGEKTSHLSYSKSIASIAAYPYTITSLKEIDKLYGCGPSVWKLFKEWRDTGSIEEVDKINEDEMIQTLKIFYEIYDVGPENAKKYYYKGWKDLDDMVDPPENWKSLSENIQWGVKYYDDFREGIPRAEAKKIGDVVLRYANKIRPGFQMIICGGYRRGKELCGDVDVVITHPDESATKDLIDPLVDIIGNKWIPRLLRISHANSKRDQGTVAPSGGHRKGGGFDTLDSAFLVWHDADLLGVEGAHNPKRRVDIIITPWKTAGCAIVGWSGGTQFERDLRKYSRAEMGMKFDSSGCRMVEGGQWVDLEGDAETLEEKERRVFEGLGLEWIEPTERCTG